MYGRTKYFLGLMILFACQNAKTPVSAVAAKEAPTPVVSTTKVAISQTSDVYILPSRATSKVQAPILATVEGLVVEVTRTVGERVTPGSKILAIKNTDPVYEFVAVPVTSSVHGVV